MLHARTPRPGHRRIPRGPEPLEPRLVMATTLVVNSFADTLSPPPGTVTLRSAIEAANAAAGPVTIDLATPGTYRLTTFQQAADPNSGGALSYTGTNNLAVVNTSGGAVTVVGDGMDSVFAINPTSATTPFTVAFQGLVITGGGSGGIVVGASAASLVVISSIVSGNQSHVSGGGILMNGGAGSLTVASSQVTNNSTRAFVVPGGDGGGIAALGTGPVTITRSTIAGNVAYGGGGGVFVNGSPLTVTGSTIRGNTAFATGPAHGGGGGIDDAGAGDVKLIGDIVEANVSSGDGGGYDDAGSGLADLLVSNSFFLSNVADGGGGGIATSGPSVTIANATLQGNVVLVSSSVNILSRGGGLYIGPSTSSGSTTPATSNVSVSGSTIAGNRADSGGGIDDRGKSLSLSTSTVEGNQGDSGGGLSIDASNVIASVFNCLFLGNSTTFYGAGGGIDQAGTGSSLALFGDQFTGNSAFSGAAVDGDVEGSSGNINKGLTIADTTFNGNFARSSGGAVVVALNYGDANLINDTLAGNSAGAYGTSGNGGAIDFVPAQPGDTLSLVDVTINDNTATGVGGGVYQAGGTLTAENTILARDTAAGLPSDDYHQNGTVTDNGGNLIGTTSGAGGYFSGDTFTGSIGLAPLMDNGTTFSNGTFFALAGAPSSQQVVQTEALLPGSPAFGHAAATIGTPPPDARGFPRPGGGATRPSSGAYEPQYAFNATANQVFVEDLYEVLLDRTADAPGLAAWAGYLNAGGSTTALAQVLGNSAPALTLDTINLVNRYLGRAPSAAETGTIVAYLQAGHTPEQAASIFMGSPEFSADYGNNQDAFIMASYQTALGRAPSPAEVTAWDGALASGLSHQAAAAGFVSSQEYLVDVIDADFAAYLGRPATAPEVATYLKAAGFGATTPFFRAVLLAASYGART